MQEKQNKWYCIVDAAYKQLDQESYDFVNAQELFDIPWYKSCQFLILTFDHQSHSLWQFMDAELHASDA